MIAAAALLLASSLEVCGCDVAQDCGQIRAMQISAESWPVLLGRCAACLSSAELAKVTREGDRIASSPSAAAPGTGETVGQALGEGQPLSFYEPRTPPDGAGGGFRTASLAAGYSFPVIPAPRTWHIPESVFLLYADATPGLPSADPGPVATAFVVSVPRLDDRGLERFLVTARHVVDPEWAHCGVRNPASMVVRLNRWTGESAYVHLALEADHARQYVTPADGSADVAVLRLDDRVLPDIESYKLWETPYSLLPTDEELEAIRSATGRTSSSNSQPIVTAGLKSHPILEGRRVAVVHSGTLTGTQADPVAIQCGTAFPPTPLRIWTIDAAVAKEASGAPVYTTMTRRGSDRETPVLLGVQSVVWPGERAAGITPSSALSELIQKALGRNGRHMNLYKGAAP